MQPEPVLHGGAFVGRERELAELEGGLERATGARGSLFLLGGEPGIGKSRLADEAAALARGRGFRVLWGRCWEAGGAPAYWPWVQALRGYLRETEPETVRAHLGAAAVDLAQILPEIHEFIPDLPAPPLTDPEGARFRLFDRTSSFLRRIAEERPLLLVIEDLHAAEPSALLLLQFLARELTDARIVVVCTYRDVEVVGDHPLTTALPELGRDPATRSLHIGGLSPPDVTAFIQAVIGSPPSLTLVDAVHEGTEGNPLFVGEVVRLLSAQDRLDEGDDGTTIRPAISAGVRAVIGQRLAMLSDQCHSILRVAAVLGAEVSLEALGQLTGRPLDELLAVLQPATAARLLVEVPGAIGRRRFSHGLVRETLYGELSAPERLTLHLRAAEVLESLYEHDLEPHLAELAHHFFESIPGPGIDRAVEYGRRAGERAATLLAYEESVRLYRMALQALELRTALDEPTRCELLLALGDALGRAGKQRIARETLLHAADVARRSGSPEQLARVALVYGGRFIWLRAGDDRHLIPLLQDALTSLGDRDDPLAVRLMGRLGGALRGGPDRDTGARLVRDAIEMAGRLEDPQSLLFALTARLGVLWWPENSAQRLTWAEECMQLARDVGDHEREVEVHYARFTALLDLGRLPDALAQLDVLHRLEREVRQPSQRWLLASTEVMLAVLQGRFTDADDLVDEAFAIGQSAERLDSEVARRIQHYLMALFRGGLDELEPTIAQAADEFHSYPVFRCFVAHLNAELGREADARRHFEGLAARDFADLPRDNFWLVGMSLLADVCAVVRDEARAERMTDLLRPFAGLHALGLPEGGTASVSRAIGRLASTRSRWDEAERSFEDAIEANRALGADPWVARSLVDQARMLLARGDGNSRERAGRLLSDARSSCEALGLIRLRDQIDAMSGPAATGPGLVTPEGPADASLVHEGEYWSVVFDGATSRIRDTKGVRYLAHLLATPHREIHALELVTAIEGREPDRRRPDPELHAAADDGAELLDRRAKAEYRDRLLDLERELAEADEWNDPERAARLREEMEFLARELAAAVGLGGRDRHAASNAERARVNVTRAIKSAVDRIAEHHPTLGRHLATTVRTGLFCSYQPDPRAPISWSSRTSA